MDLAHVTRVQYNIKIIHNMSPAGKFFSAGIRSLSIHGLEAFYEIARRTEPEGICYVHHTCIRLLLQSDYSLLQTDGRNEAVR